MSLTRVREISEDEVLLDYAHGELLEPRRNPGAAQLAAQIQSVGGFAKLNRDQRQILINAIHRSREAMIGFPLRHNARWFDAALDIDELPTLRLTSWFEQPKFMSARTIDALLQTPGASEYTFTDFRPNLMRGRVIVLAPALDGPLCLIEGTGRCCELVRHRRSGAVEPRTIDIHVGVCSDIEDYGPFRDGAAIPGARWWVPALPELTIKALLQFREKAREGVLVEAVTLPWFTIIDLITRDPSGAYQIDPFKWEEIIAGAYERAGFDEVILTPRSGDRGRDVIATRHGVGSIRIFDQMKAYAPNRSVPPKDVRELIGVLTIEPNVSKAVLTTTSDFSPGVLNDPDIQRLVPHRLELKPRAVLLPWLADLARKRDSGR